VWLNRVAALGQGLPLAIGSQGSKYIYIYIYTHTLFVTQVKVHPTDLTTVKNKLTADGLYQPYIDRYIDIMFHMKTGHMKLL
jgi:hypothetical protein